MMHSGGLRADMRQHPILLAFGAVWALEAGMNALYGYRRGGGGIGALGYATVFLAIAFIAAWLPTRLAHVASADPLAMLKRFALVALTALCFALSQMAGNAVIGVTMADGAAQRDAAATSHITAKEKLDRLRSESKALGTQAAPDQVQARIDAELATVVRRSGQTIGELSNNCADASAAPAACQRVAKLKTELAAAKRKADLDQLIEKASTSFSGTQAVAEGSPETQVVARLTGFSDEDVRFYWNVVIVFVIGLFANLGFAIAGLGRQNSTASDVTPASGGNWGGNQSGQAKLAGPPSFPLLPGPSGAVAQPQAAFHGAPYPRPSSPEGGGANINIHVGGPGAALAPGSSAAPQPREPLPPRAQPGAAEAQPLHTHASTAVALPARAVPLTPVDRNPVRQMMDDLLIFKAAALVEQPGAATDADSLYQRYVHHAGPRALARDAFETMFQAVTNVPLTVFGGVRHYSGIALRAHAQVH